MKEFECDKMKWPKLIELYTKGNYKRLDMEATKILRKLGIIFFSDPSASSTKLSDEGLEFKFLFNKRVVFLKISHDGKAIGDIISPPFDRSERKETKLDRVKWDKMKELYGKAKHKKLIKEASKCMDKLGFLVFAIEIAKVELNDNKILFELHNNEEMVRLSISNGGGVSLEMFWREINLPFP